MQQRLSHVAGSGAGQRQQPLKRAGQPVAQHARSIEALPFAVGARQQAGQIAIAALVHDQAAQGVTVRAVHGVGDKQIGAEYRFESDRRGRLVEFDQSVEVANIGHRHRGHAQRRAAARQFLDPNRAVAQGKLAVHAQVHEGAGRA